MSRALSCAVLSLALVVIAAVSPAALAQVSGTVFHDRDADGLRDPGEEALEGVGVRLYGKIDAGDVRFDQTLATPADGTFTFAPGNGCYLIAIDDPPGWRRTLARTDERLDGSAGYSRPTGVRRFGGAPELLDRLLDGTVRYTGIGDSIAYNWNSCFDTSSFFYSREVRDRLRCVSPSGQVNLDEAAVKGEHSDDLLVDETNNLNNVFRVIEANPQFVTISMIGNDLLNDEPDDDPPTQAQINRFVNELLDSRQNLQEVVAALVSELPGAAIELNTLYDNLAYQCNSSTAHNEWLPILNQILRDLAWGQARRVTNAEIYAEFAHEDLAGGCNGFRDEICLFLDGIHPRGSGYRTIREKVWESIGGASLGPRDGLGATQITGADHGYLRLVRRLYPTAWDARSGASITDGANALDGDDGGLGASIGLGIGGEEVRFSGFPAWYDEIVPVRVVAGVRYRTTGTVTDDFYRIEASVDGSFRAPAGHSFTPFDWNFYTPIVGGGGPNAPADDPDYPSAKLLVRPNVASNREASATLTKNPLPSADGRGYEWPALTRDELGTTEIRVASAPVAGTSGDNYRVVVDAVWLDVYGIEKARPAEIANLLVAKAASGGGLDVSFDALASSELYNVYFGSLGELAQGGTFTHGSATQGEQVCDAPTAATGPSRLVSSLPSTLVPAGSSYILVTGRIDGVESPGGSSTTGDERDRSQNVCP